MSKTYNKLEFILLLLCPFLPSSQDTGFSHLPAHSPIGLFPVSQTGLRVYVQFPLPGVVGLLPHDEFCPSSPLAAWNGPTPERPSPLWYPHHESRLFQPLICFSVVILRITVALLVYVFFFLHQNVSSVGVSETEGFECFFSLLTSSLAHLLQLCGCWEKTCDSWVRNTQWSSSGGFSISSLLLSSSGWCGTHRAGITAQELCV